MKQWLLSLAGAILFSIGCNAQTPSDFEQLLQQFTKEYATHQIPTVRLSYVLNLEDIASSRALAQQQKFFQKYQNQLQGIDRSAVKPELRLTYDQLEYEIGLNLERIDLEKRFSKIYDLENIPDYKLHSLPLSKEWYRYFLKKWLSVDNSPEELMAFGKQEVQKVQEEMRAVQKDLGFAQDSLAFFRYLNQDSFFLETTTQILDTFKMKQEVIQQNLGKQFHDYAISLPPIARNINTGSSKVPGFYYHTNQTFYFNFQSGRYNRRKMDWLYIHEAIPGHHLQIQFNRKHNQEHALSGLFRYSAYSEGWAAYCEEIGKELGLYASATDYYGKLEWDLIRSVRVVLDIGLNYLGWTDQEAHAYWKAQIANQDELAEREIARMKRWPVQVLTYKVGAAKIMELKKRFMRSPGADVRDFHERILRAGPVPLAILEKHFVDIL